MNPATLEAVGVALIAAFGAAGAKFVQAMSTAGRQARVFKSLAAVLADYIYSNARHTSSQGATQLPYPDRVKQYLTGTDTEGVDPPA